MFGILAFITLLQLYTVMATLTGIDEKPPCPVPWCLELDCSYNDSVTSVLVIDGQECPQCPICTADCLPPSVLDLDRRVCLFKQQEPTPPPPVVCPSDRCPQVRCAEPDCKKRLRYQAWFYDNSAETFCRGCEVCYRDCRGPSYVRVAKKRLCISF